MKINPYVQMAKVLLESEPVNGDVGLAILSEIIATQDSLDKISALLVDLTTEIKYRIPLPK